MYTQTDKPKENQSRTGTKSVAQKRSNSKRGFAYVDNRPKSVAKKSKQIAINTLKINSITQLHKANDDLSVRHLANTPFPPIQRVVNLVTATHSVNNQYFIDPSNTGVLYSDVNAAAPLPTGLYARGNEALNDPANTPLHSWTPNVRLFSNAEALTASTNRVRQVPSDSFCGLAGLFGFTRNVPDHTLEDTLIGNIQGQINGNPNAPTSGVIGKNDCQEFATYLHHAIGAEIAVPNNSQRALQETRLGDRMGHSLTDPNDCPYHFATIVATDAVSKVTLEANAGLDLTAPQFFIRNGITGFMNANNATYNNGQKHTITGIETDAQQSHQDYLQRGQLQQNAQQSGTYTTTGNGGGGRRITASVASL